MFLELVLRKKILSKNVENISMRGYNGYMFKLLPSDFQVTCEEQIYRFYFVNGRENTYRIDIYIDVGRWLPYLDVLVVTYKDFLNNYQVHMSVQTVHQSFFNSTRLQYGLIKVACDKVYYVQ